MKDRTDTFALAIDESIWANTGYIDEYNSGHFDNDNFFTRLLSIYTEILSFYKKYLNSKGDAETRDWLVDYLAEAYAFLEVWKICITTQHKEALDIEELEVNLDYFEEWLRQDTNNDQNIVEMIFWTNYAYRFSIKAKEQTEETIEGNDDIRDDMRENYICRVKNDIECAQIAIIAFVARLGEYPNIDQPIVF